MARINGHLIGDAQSKTLAEHLESVNRGADIDWRGYDRFRTGANNSIEKYNTDAHVNRVLFWLTTKSNEYVRQPNKGGVLYSLLGTLSNDTNLSEWETEIKARFHTEFGSDLELVYLKLSTDKKNRKLNIEMVVRDVLSNRTFPITTGASI